ncbi:hypothetical protein [Lacrimispora celerecrescens]|uniref:Uncharacterized protein n=1 Tax=Lacrimispora celerecrescens TaxID=29354 RepID=A0A084JMD4_9FIRM|nr:hypothetical protein [Lacrimispora celerecrescens]KEZ90118.1 hypothetical protein IO98_11570 [Lacrimispora celerecrescens]
MNKESKVVTNIGTIDFNKCDVLTDDGIILFIGITDIPEPTMEEVHRAVEEAPKYYIFEWDQEWEEAKINEIMIQIRLSDSRKPRYSISICFEDIKKPLLCECAYVDIDLSAYEAEMKGLIAKALIKELM